MRKSILQDYLSSGTPSCDQNDEEDEDEENKGDGMLFQDDLSDNEGDYK